MIALLISIAAPAPVAATPPPPLANAVNSFAARAFSCSIARDASAKDQFSGYLGAMVASKERPAIAAKVKLVVEADTTFQFFGNQDASSVDGIHYVSFKGWPLMWRFVFSFDPKGGFGERKGTVEIKQYDRAKLISTEQWQCSSRRYVGADK